MIVGPIIVCLARNYLLKKEYFMKGSFKSEEFHGSHEYLKRLLNVLADLGWADVKYNTLKFTEYGLFFFRRATSYGVTISYLPTLKKLDELLFGDPLILRNNSKESTEQHLDREINIWGSDGAHSFYFKILDGVIIDIFNKPINEQPKGIIDIGCGNGAFLQHLFTIVKKNTLRGEILDQYPLQLIGVDYNQAALKVAHKNLIQTDFNAKVIWGDISNPDSLATNLKNRYDLNMNELLNVRTFIDHNRVWKGIKEISTRFTSSTGAFAHRGKRIDNNIVVHSLKEHFEKWKPHIEIHGLLLIELHTVRPELASQHIGSTAATAYDLTHGYSNQYIIEIDEFLSVIEEVGLTYDKHVFRKFPNSDLATVSINLIKSKSITEH